MNIEKYVTEYLADAGEMFLNEIVWHGVYNTGADVSQGDNEAEYDAIAAEFAAQAQQKLRALEATT